MSLPHTSKTDGRALMMGLDEDEARDWMTSSEQSSDASNDASNDDCASNETWSDDDMFDERTSGTGPQIDSEQSLTCTIPATPTRGPGGGFFAEPDQDEVNEA